MDNDKQETRERALEMARRVLAELETKAAGNTALTILVNLVIELEETRQLVERLRNQVSS